MILFLHIEKTAGTSLAYYLKSKFGKKFIDLYPIENGQYITDKDIKNAIKFNSPQVISSHKIFLDKINLEQFDKIIITIRDPFERFISHYNHLLEINRVECLSFSDAISHSEFKNLQFSKLGGVKSKQILEKINKDKKLIIFNKATFKEDFNLFVGENKSTPLKNSRKNKLIKSNIIKSHDDFFKQTNLLEYELLEWIESNYNSKGLEKALKFTKLKSDKKNVAISNNYRKYFRIPILIIKKYLTTFKLLKTKNMAGYYICK